MQHEVLFFSPHFIGDTLNTKAECVKDSLICRKYLFLAETFALRSMGIQLVSSPQLTAVSSGVSSLHCNLDMPFKDWSLHINVLLEGGNRCLCKCHKI